MKKIIFQKGTFLLTDKEFEEAKITWKKKNNYYCQRLGATISDRFQFAMIPENELDFKVWVYKHQNGGMAKVFEQNGVYFKEIRDGEKMEKIKINNVDKKFKEKLIDQEKYYEMTSKKRNKLLLK